MSSGTALVTGGARGMGAEIAYRLAEDGFAIAVSDVRDCEQVASGIRAQGGAAAAYRCDIADWSAVEVLVASAERDLGPLRAVVQVAGVFRPVPFLGLSPESWREVLGVNVDGTFNVCRLAAERIAAGGGGSIVAISSTAARFTWDGSAHYCSSKAAIEGLVRSMAYELGRHRVRVNAVAPGTIRTPATSSELSLPGVEQAEAAACPLGRVGEVADVAQAVRYLCDEQRSGWITGQTIVVDGGYSTHGQAADFGSTIDTTVNP